MFALVLVAALAYAVYDPSAAASFAAATFSVIHDIVVYSYHTILSAVA